MAISSPKEQGCPLIPVSRKAGPPLYLLSIAIARRVGLLALYLSGRKPGGFYGQHLENARGIGLLKYLRLSTFIHSNTDGPLNPYSKVYDLKSVQADFPDFQIEDSYKRFMHAPPLPVGRLPLETLLGWHLWVHLRPTHSGLARSD